jgi:hypothetical protein
MFNQISTVGTVSPLWLSSGRPKHREAPWLTVERVSNSAYGAPNSDSTLPTQSRGQGQLVLQIYGEGNERRKAGGGNATRPIFNGGGGGI